MTDLIRYETDGAIGIVTINRPDKRNAMTYAMLGEFLERMRIQAQNPDVLERQRIVRLLVKEVVVGKDNITIRHSIPNTHRPSGGGATGAADPSMPVWSGGTSAKSSLLRTWSDLSAAGQHLPALRIRPVG